MACEQQCSAPSSKAITSTTAIYYMWTWDSILFLLSLKRKLSHQQHPYQKKINWFCGWKIWEHISRDCPKAILKSIVCFCADYISNTLWGKGAPVLALQRHISLFQKAHNFSISKIPVLSPEQNKNVRPQVKLPCIKLLCYHMTGIPTVFSGWWAYV